MGVVRREAGERAGYTPGTMGNKNGREKNGQFGRGVSGNPKGRPKGSLNWGTKLLLEELEKNAKGIIAKLIEDALAGKAYAMKVCIDQMTKNAGRLELELPALEGAGEVRQAMKEVSESVVRGEVTAAEGKALIGVIEHTRKAIDTEDLVKGLARLEESERRRREGCRGS
jgi:hypothetical protein